MELEKLLNGGVIIPQPKLVNIWGNPKIGRGTKIAAFVEIGDKVEIGENCKIEAFVFIPPGVRIGNNVFIGPGTVFTNDKYPTWKRYGLFKNTIVEDDAVIGANCTILPGITIGEGSRIGAGSVVVKPTRPLTTYTGNPAKPRI